MKQPQEPTSRIRRVSSASRASAISVSRMQAIDSACIETLGIPRLLLMEHAGLAVARAAVDLIRQDSGHILVCCGMGHNGGDGLCAARHLCGWGYSVRVLVAGKLQDLKEEGATYAKILARMDIKPVEFASGENLSHVKRLMDDADLIIDALLGIGLKRDVREPTGSLIRSINASNRPVVSVDIPSGLDGDTGMPMGNAVKATTSVTFGAPKQGSFIGDGPAYVGELVVDTITIPQHLLEGS